MIRFRGVRLQPDHGASSLGQLDGTGTAERRRCQLPVISFSNEKNPRLRPELRPQFTGTLW